MFLFLADLNLRIKNTEERTVAGEGTKWIHAAAENHKQQWQSAVEGVAGTIQGGT